MSNDLFADLLSVGTGASRKKNVDSNLSLSQRMNMPSQSVNGSSNGNATDWTANLDFLDNIGSSSQSVNKIPSSDISGDLFADFKQPESQIANSIPISTQTNQIQQNNQLDFLDDFFSSPAIPASTVPETQLQQPEPSNSVKTESPITNTVTSQTSTDKRDEALAELMDMGFPIEKANEALDSTESGYDLNGAISYLMNAAHSKTKKPSRQQQQSVEEVIPQRHSQNQRQEDIGSIVNDLSNELKNKASFLFQVGRKKVQQGMEMYKQQQFEKNDNQPLWMKNQEKYKNNSMKIPGQEDEEEMDRETMRRLVEQQREKDMKLRVEKERRERKEKENAKREAVARQNELFSEPTPPSNRVNRSSVMNEPLPRRRPQQKNGSSTISSPQSHTTSTSVNPKSDMQPVKSKPADEALFDLLNTPPASSPSPSPSLSGSSSRLDKLRSSKVDDEPVYSSSSRRRRPTPSKQESKKTVALPNVPITDSQLEKFNGYRSKASDYFKKGDFAKSLEFYEFSLSALPSQHHYKIIAYSNISIVYSKIGNPKLQLENSNEGLKILQNISENISDLNNVIIEDDKTGKSFWIKLLSKKAEALEHLERFEESLSCYTKLIENGSSSKPTMDGKRRCNNILNPPSKTTKSTSTPTINRKKSTAAPSVPSPNNTAVKRIQEQNIKAETLENEKFQLHDTIEAKLNSWKAGKEDNLRALLSSLHLILWPELNWKPVSLTDLVLDKKVKLIYMKAVAKTHPDKIGGGESTERKLIANGVFISLNQAWDKFKEVNGIS
ncbi:hypothetical protein CANARDRAFT_28837 [[Candida] arabinofermentans NRRL YB-2248]|uniref:UBA domain-containing protein n=1 Tax=[Candida] arabinofermentans NRRL YB-2248 TaxID=983967 RepID=A0A1E4SYW1_9ASCO|nr:hypothetical protein CANARDRAFT_28837 [[Candida] arabinofermentans NRRL YB-2248]